MILAEVLICSSWWSYSCGHHCWEGRFYHRETTDKSGWRRPPWRSRSQIQTDLSQLPTMHRCIRCICLQSPRPMQAGEDAIRTIGRKIKYSFKLWIRGDRVRQHWQSRGKGGRKWGEERLTERRGNETKEVQRSATDGRSREKINKPKKNRKKTLEELDDQPTFSIVKGERDIEREEERLHLSPPWNWQLKSASSVSSLHHVCSFSYQISTEVMVKHRLGWKMRANVLTLLEKHLYPEDLIRWFMTFWRSGAGVKVTAAEFIINIRHLKLNKTSTTHSGFIYAHFKYSNQFPLIQYYTNAYLILFLPLLSGLLHPHMKKECLCCKGKWCGIDARILEKCKRFHQTGVLVRTFGIHGNSKAW